VEGKLDFRGDRGKNVNLERVNENLDLNKRGRRTYRVPAKDPVGRN